MKKIGLRLIILAFSLSFSGSAPLPVLHAQASREGDFGTRHRPDRIFPVGHTTAHINVRGTLGENRPVDVGLWYPARFLHDCDRSEGDEGNAGCSPTPASYTSRLNGVPLLPQWAPLSWTIGTRDAFENLPLSHEGRFPVVVFSHGHQNNAIDYVYTLEGIASHGFIVAAPDHVNDTQDDVRIDFVNAAAKRTLIPCFDGLPSPCSHAAPADVPMSMTDRVHDVSAVLDALPTWFGERVDMTRVGIMGHSRGTVTALAVAGGSTIWGFPPERRVKALMGMAIGAPAITFGADVQSITIPALLLAGALDTTAPLAISQAAYDTMASTEKELVIFQNAKHRHFDSGLCAQMQSSGAIGQAHPNAILDLETANGLLKFPSSGVAMDFCSFDTFTVPTDIRPLVASVTGFNVTPSNVPTTGLDTAEMKRNVIELAVTFFGTVLNRSSDDQ
jgi:predicted dienelactone hydrolase